MKRIIIILVFVFSCVHLFSQNTIIEMEKENGVYKVQCKLNGAPMKMYFDTGASMVSISLNTAMYLYDNGLITDADFVDNTKSQNADGSISDNMVINIKDIEIEGLHLKNTKALVNSSLRAPLLFGQTAIQQLGSYTIDGKYLIINTMGQQQLSAEKRSYYDSVLDSLFNSKDGGNSELINDILSKLGNVHPLNEIESLMKFLIVKRNNDYPKVIEMGQEFEQRFPYAKASHKLYVMQLIALACIEENQYEMADNYLEKIDISHCKDINSWGRMINIAGQISLKKKNLDIPHQLIIAQACREIAKLSNISFVDLSKKTIESKDVATALTNYTAVYAYSPYSDNTLLNKLLTLAVNAGGSRALLLMKNKKLKKVKVSKSDLELFMLVQ